MKPTEGAAEAHCDFAGDESTSVMGVDLLDSLTERSRRIDVTAPPPEPEISIEIDEPEPVTTMSPAAAPLPPLPPLPPMIPDGEFPGIGDEEPTAMMEEPEPTTVARRLAPQPVPVAAPDPQCAPALPPRALATIRVVPLPAPEPESIAGTEPAAAAGSRLSVFAAIALGVAAWTVGLGHHYPAAAISPPPPSVSRAVTTPLGAPAQVGMIMGSVRATLGPLVLRHRI